MKYINIYFSCLFLFCSCSNIGSSNKAEKVSEDVFIQNGWIYDLKNSSSKIDFYTIAKTSSTLVSSISEEDKDKLIENSIIIHFKLDKEGKYKNQIRGAFIQNTSKNVNELRFPRCLNICPLTIANVDSNANDTYKSSYSISNSFTMELNDNVLFDAVLNQKKIKIRIPISINNKNTEFKFFEFDFIGYTTNLIF